MTALTGLIGTATSPQIMTISKKQKELNFPEIDILKKDDTIERING